VVGILGNAIVGAPIVALGGGASIPLTLGAFLWRLRACDSTLWAIERATQRDLDHDGEIGQPAPAERVVLLDPYKGRAAQRADGSAEDRAGFAGFVKGCESDTSARRWERRIGRERYQSWRDALLASGWARARGAGDRAGWELCASADEVIAALG